ncbi:patatin-like phospholipase family protein [Nostoc sp. ATCC 53789]|uniref:patatin-like phospholipase family protein n=1 Tax=Nostoc sp. ATCC 53789 TaxID=76335 RepID=UPI000DECC894|nr:patatin-like phospholipase family protein [Nostoc sp. ATCC 53789]QHG17817.1 hypothetical protein GJB62_18755 [Nostoc sp. ATCC 53789]RCJ26315.1 hypothetical protein A6V25_03295 [Nostoc sp. ATCC 53789]
MTNDKTVESSLNEFGNLWLVAFISLLSFIFFGGFLGLDQILEFYRVFILNINDEKFALREIVLSVVICLFIIVISCLCLFLAQRFLKIPKNPCKVSLTQFGFFSQILNYLLQSFEVGFFSSVPLLSIAIGFFRSDSGFEDKYLWLSPKCAGIFFLIGFLVWLFIAAPVLWKMATNHQKPKVNSDSSCEMPTHQNNQEREHPYGWISCLPILGIIIISVFSNFRSDTQIIEPIKYYLPLGIYLVFYLVVLYLIYHLKDTPRKLKDEFNTIVIIVSVSLVVIVISLFSIDYFLLSIAVKSNPYFFQSLCQTVGSITLIALFLVTILTLVYPFYYFGFNKNIQVTAFAVIIIPVILAFVFSGLDLNDNHQIRLITATTATPATTISKNESKGTSDPKFEKWIKEETLDSKFKNWLGKRQEEIKKTKQKTPYPIYIISAQGGGIFAAYHAASTLSRLQDLCPAFAHHVFAISGVSGGSLGAAAFSSLVKNTAPPPSLNAKDCLLDYKKPLEKQDDGRGPLEKKAHELLDKDLLSPLLGAGLFSDFVQRFIPIPIESLDRARGLEYAFEGGWKSEWGKNNPLADSYYKHWNPDKDDAPALVLNTTVVGTGERLLLSPFNFNSPDSKFPPLNDIRTVACSVNGANIDFPLSTAAVLSARFPLVTPVGWFKKCNDANGNQELTYKNGLKTRLADGGYFENSGFTTARDIGQRLEKILEKEIKDKTFKVVYLAITNNDFLEPSKVQGLNELLSPILAFLNSREARGRSVVKQGEYELDGKIDKDSDLKDHRFRQFYLTHVDGGTPVKNNDGKTPVKEKGPKLPLGWYLSKISQDSIRDKVGNPEKIDCSPGKRKKEDNNNCVMESIIDEINSSQ